MQSRPSSSDFRSGTSGDSSSSSQHQAASTLSPYGDGGYQDTAPCRYDFPAPATPALVATFHTDGGSSSMVNHWSNGASAPASNLSAVHSAPFTPTGSSYLQGQPTQTQSFGVPAPQSVDPTMLMLPQGPMHTAHRIAASGQVTQPPVWGNQVSYSYDGSGMSPYVSGPAHSSTQTSTRMPFVSHTPQPTGPMLLKPQPPNLAFLPDAGEPPAGSGNTLTGQSTSAHQAVQEARYSHTTWAPQFNERGKKSRCSKCHCPQPQDSGDDGGRRTCVICDSFLTGY